MENNYNLLSLIGPDIGAILWMPEEELSNRLVYFKELDYLFDGIIAEIAHNSINETKKSISFLTKSFGLDLWLIYIGPKASNSEIDEQISLVTEIQKKGLKVLLLSQNISLKKDDIEKKYPHLKFTTP